MQTPRSDGPRGIDVDTNGVVHMGMGTSNHLGLFDESKCTTPECTEGWTFIEFPGPRHVDTSGQENMSFRTLSRTDVRELVRNLKLSHWKISFSGRNDGKNSRNDKRDCLGGLSINPLIFTKK